MSNRRFRFISTTYRVLVFILILIPGIASGFLAWRWSVARTLDQSRRELHHAAETMMDIVRMRYDLVQNYLFQEEEYLAESLQSAADIIYRAARELELECARQHLSESRAQAIFLAFSEDLAVTSERQIVILDASDRVIYHPMLPEGFDMGHYEWVHRMRETEAGNLRYTWSFPGEPQPVERMAEYRLIHTWNWMLSLEGRIPDPEKSDFADRQIQGLNDFITGYHAPAGGYAMILSGEDGTVITHPEISSGSADRVSGADALLSVRRGNVTYTDAYGIQWEAGIAYFPPKKWHVIVTARTDEILRQTYRFATRLAMVIGALVIVVFLVFYRLNRSLIYAAVSQVRKSNLHLLD